MRKIALAEQNKPMQSATTLMENDGDIAIEQKPVQVDLDSGLLDSAKLGVDEGIAQFLAKPQQIAAFQWAGATAKTVLFSDYPFTHLDDVGLWRLKLAGFRYFRGTAVYTVMVNAQKFQAGRLRLVYLPFASYAGSYTQMRYRSLCSITQIPGVELDAACQTSMVLKAPFISPLNYYDLQNKAPNMGEAKIFVYSPLVTGSGSDGNADVQVFLHWEDCTFTAPIVPQMNSRVKKGNQADKERKALTDNSLSGTLGTLSTSMSTISKIPVFSAVAQPAAWALSAFSGAAQAFGWSKPYSDEPVKRMVIQPMGFITNVDNLDNSLTLGLCSSNQITQLPGFAGSDLDEMSFEYLSQIPAYIATAQWVTGTAEDTVLYSKEADISTMYGDLANVGSHNYVDFVPAAYIASTFKYWRSSIRITIKIVKTSFHSGRLMFWYNPNYQTGVGTTTPSVSTSTYLLREFLDVRENSEWTFIIPYVSAYPMEIACPSTLVSQATTGKWGISVVNRLRAPETVNQGVEVLIEASAGPDFEVYVPRAGTYTQTTVNFAQMNEAVSNSCDVQEEHGIAGSKIMTKQDLTNAQYCIGEDVQSYRQLVKRFSQLSVPDPDFVGSTRTFFETPADPIYHHVFNPYAFTAIHVNDAGSVVYSPGFCNDYLSYISGMFALNRGSVQLKILSDTKLTATTSGVLSRGIINTQPISSFPMITQVGISKARAGMVFGQPLPSGQFGNALEVHVPSYQRTHSRYNFITSTNSDGSTRTINPVGDAGVSVEFFSNTSTLGTIYRAAGDDFSFGYFIGVPPLCLNYNIG